MIKTLKTECYKLITYFLKLPKIMKYYPSFNSLTQIIIKPKRKKNKENK